MNTGEVWSVSGFTEVLFDDLCLTTDASGESINIFDDNFDFFGVLKLLYDFGDVSSSFNSFCWSLLNLNVLEVLCLWFLEILNEWKPDLISFCDSDFNFGPFYSSSSYT